jgi:AbrB family looped-hinge helix DNA binding protein
MPVVDPEGRVTLPKSTRERLGLTPGTEVEVVEEDGAVVVRPARSPEDIIGAMERLVEEASVNRQSQSSSLVPIRVLVQPRPNLVATVASSLPSP